MPAELFLAIMKDEQGNLTKAAYVDENDVDGLKDAAISGDAVLVRGELLTWQGEEKGSGSWEAPATN